LILFEKRELYLSWEEVVLLCNLKDNLSYEILSPFLIYLGRYCRKA
jgi:hypothetical protein